MKSILKIEFDAIMTYDDWTIFEHKGKYYAADEDGLFEVVLKNKKNIKEYENCVIDFGNDYNGESDDCEWVLGFDRTIDCEN